MDKSITKIIDYEKLKQSEAIQYLEKTKKYRAAIDDILMLESGLMLQRREGVLQHQNTNKENYPDILKDYLSDINKSSDHIMKTLIVLKSNEITASLLVDSPVLIGHHIDINTKDKAVYSLSIKEFATEYLTYVRKQYDIILALLKRTDRTAGMFNTKTIELMESLLTKENILENPHPARMRSKLGDKIDRIKRKVKLTDEETEAIDLLLREDDDTFKPLYHSTNLYDEKFTKKEDIVFASHFRGTDEDLISKESGKILSSKVLISNYLNLVFKIDYYFKKHLTEVSSKRKFLPVMCSIKDYLSKDKAYLEGLEEYDKDHPFTKQVSAKSSFESSIDKMSDAYIKAKNIARKINIALTYSDWKQHLHSTRILHGYKIDNEDTILSQGEMIEMLKKATLTMAERIYDRSMSESGTPFSLSINEEYYTKDLISDILDYFYLNGTAEDIAFDKTKEYFHDRATFHSTLKDSLIIDFREGAKQTLNTFAQEKFDEDEEFKGVVDLMERHPYHNYYELDKDIFSRSSMMDIPYLIDFIKNSAQITPAVNHRCGLKFRKLGNYKARGIYFSHTTTMGLDYRKGQHSHVHELAHHIDLNSYKRDRKKMAALLYEHFRYKINNRISYYLKDEELIARAAEVALLLQASKYKELKNRHQHKNQLLNTMRHNYENSGVYAFMKPWEEYFPDEVYLNIEEMIQGNNLHLVDLVMEYFESFWNVTDNDGLVMSDVKVDYGYNHANKYPKSHHSYSYLLSKIYGVSHPNANKEEYLNAILGPLLG